MIAVLDTFPRSQVSLSSFSRSELHLMLSSYFHSCRRCSRPLWSPHRRTICPYVPLSPFPPAFDLRLSDHSFPNPTTDFARMGKKFMLVLCLGTLAMTIGFAFRIVVHFNATSLGLYIIETLVRPTPRFPSSSEFETDLVLNSCSLSYFRYAFVFLFIHKIESVI